MIQINLGGLPQRPYLHVLVLALAVLAPLASNLFQQGFLVFLVVVCLSLDWITEGRWTRHERSLDQGTQVTLPIVTPPPASNDDTPSAASTGADGDGELRAMRPNATPVVLSFASGKGGTGKTTLAVAFAYELSRSARTLLVDLDYYNRGLTGLLSGLQWPRRGPSPNAETHEDGRDWQVREVGEELLLVACPPVSEGHMRSLQARTVAELCQDLRSLVTSVAAAQRCGVVVMDTHGGPDSLSTAACQLARYTVMVSEPDRQSVYGTWNFARTLRGEGVEEGAIKLVFNRVTWGYSTSFLVQFYEKYLATQVGSPRVLSVFPYERFIGQTVGEDPIPTQVYPFSLLSRKVAVAISDLLGHTPSVQLRRVPLLRFAAIRRARFATLGGTGPVGLWRWLQLFAIAAPTSLGVMLAVQGVNAAYSDPVAFGTATAVGATTGAIGLTIAMVVYDLVRSRSDRFTFCLRTSRRLGALANWAGLFGVLVGTMYVVGYIGARVGPALEDARANAPELGVLGVNLVAAVAGTMMGTVGLLGVGVMAVWNEWGRYLETSVETRHVGETVARGVVMAGALVAGLVGLWGQ